MAWRSSWNSIHLCLHIIWSNIGFFWMPERADVISVKPQIRMIKHAAHSQVKFIPACWELGHRPGRTIWKVICARMYFNNSFHALQFHLECIFHCGSHNKLTYWLCLIKGLLQYEQTENLYRFIMKRKTWAVMNHKIKSSLGLDNITIKAKTEDNKEQTSPQQQQHTTFVKVEGGRRKCVCVCVWERERVHALSDKQVGMRSAFV